MIDERAASIADSLVGGGYFQQGREATRGRQKEVRTLISNRKLPIKGWDDFSIEQLLNELALMDSNNFIENVGVGEREARIFSRMVARRHFNMGHGIGRSGDVAAVQPKAAGSSLLLQVTNFLAKHALELAGLTEVKGCLCVPMATGMSIALCMQALHLEPNYSTRKVILWSRIDQKSCLKALALGGYEVIPIDPIPDPEYPAQLITNIPEFERIISERQGEIFACVTTTSCFAPRSPDNTEAIGRLCSTHDLVHVVNNAYGLQCSRTMKKLNRTMRVGRVDAIIQSMDKNFMVPVGGAIIASPDKKKLQGIGKIRRTQEEPILLPFKSYSLCIHSIFIVFQDLFITLLSMGQEGFTQLIRQREELVDTFREQLREFASSRGEQLLESPENTISFAMSLTTCVGTNESDVSVLGAMLYKRCVSGARVVTCSQEEKVIAGLRFRAYGSSSSEYDTPYLTSACAIGVDPNEIQEYFIRLAKVFDEHSKKQHDGKLPSDP